MDIQVSAPGKVILFGEHAVVYGYPAIAASIDLYVHLHFSEHIHNTRCKRFPKYIIHFSDFTDVPISLIKDELDDMLQNFDGVDNTTLLKSCIARSSHFLKDYPSLVKHPSIYKSLAVILLVETLVHTLCAKSNICCANRRIKPLYLRIKSDLPIGAGLGSSAAYCTTVAASFLYIHGFITDEDYQNESHSLFIQSIAHEAEKIMHVSPSGIDTSISARGGIIRFQKDLISNSIQMNSLCNSYLNRKKIIIIDTQMPRSTADAVNQVANFYSNDQQRCSKIFKEIGSICDEAISKLQISSTSSNEKFYESVLGLIARNQILLSNLDVSNPILDKIIKNLSEIGMSAKLTGAGKGGCVITFPMSNCTDPENIKTICELLKAYNANVIETTLAVPGICIKSNIKKRSVL